MLAASVQSGFWDSL